MTVIKDILGGIIIACGVIAFMTLILEAHNADLRAAGYPVPHIWQNLSPTTVCGKLK